MKRWIAAVLAVSLCFSMTGCSRIVKKVSEVFKENVVIGSIYTYNIWMGMSGKVNGKLTYFNGDHILCNDSLKEQKNYLLKYDITVEKGSASLILRADDGDTFITEGTSTGEMNLITKKGKNELVLVGKKAAVTLKITMDEVESTESKPESDQTYYDKAAKIDTEVSEVISMNFINGKLTQQEFKDKLQEQKALAVENIASALHSKELNDQDINLITVTLNQYLDEEYLLLEEILPVCKELKETGKGLDALNGLTDRVNKISEIAMTYQSKIQEIIKSIKTLQKRYNGRLPDNFLLKIVDGYDNKEHFDWLEQFYQ